MQVSSDIKKEEELPHLGLAVKTSTNLIVICVVNLITRCVGLMCESFFYSLLWGVQTEGSCRKLVGLSIFFSFLPSGFIIILLDSVFCGFRLWRIVQAEMQSSLEAKRVQQGVWHVLCEVQVCATWDGREQGDVWGMLHWHDHPWEQDQMSIGWRMFPLPSLALDLCM